MKLTYKNKIIKKNSLSIHETSNMHDALLLLLHYNNSLNSGFISPQFLNFDAFPSNRVFQVSRRKKFLPGVHNLLGGNFQIFHKSVWFHTIVGKKKRKKKQME